MSSLMNVFCAKRMEHLRYVALQFAHLALVQHPVLQEKSFADLQERCPELCEEDCSLVECYPGIVLKALPSLKISLQLNNGGWEITFSLEFGLLSGANCQF